MASVLVTGASTGIGAATAVHLDRRGHRVFAGVRREADAERLRRVASERLTPVFLDVTDDSEIESVAKALRGELGDAGLDGLVNNAGIAIGGPLEFTPLAEWRRQFDVNVFGQIALTKALIPMLRNATGRIVFMSSISGRVSTPLMGPYGASKHAIEAIGQSLREELRPWSIRVAVVEPGAVKTAIWEKGRAYADAIEAAAPPEEFELYGDRFAYIRAQIEQQDRDGVSPVRVAQAVDHALFSARPKPRYLVGVDARAAGALERVLPDRVFGWFVRHSGP